MKTSALFHPAQHLLGVAVCLGALTTAGTALAQDEWARVISRVPVVQQVAVPQQVCQVEQVVTERRSGAGAALGAIAGGAMGNAIGDGGGRAAATILGLVGGAVLGNRIEGGGQPQVEHVQRCGTQTRFEQRTVAYQVTYEYAGRQYTVQMPQDPGPQIRVRVAPVVGSSGVISTPSGGIYGSNEAPLAASENQPIVAAPAPLVTAPAPIAVPQQPPAVIQQGFAPIYPSPPTVVTHQSPPTVVTHQSPPTVVTYVSPPTVVTYQAPPTVVTVQREYVPLFTPGPPVFAVAPSYYPVYRPHWRPAPPSIAFNVDVHRGPPQWHGHPGPGWKPPGYGPRPRWQ